MSILCSSFFLIFTVLYSAPIPVGLQSFQRIQWNPVKSSGMELIPVNSTELQTEIEIELESRSKHMCTNSCKHKDSIYTDFCMCQ